MYLRPIRREIYKITSDQTKRENRVSKRSLISYLFIFFSCFISFLLLAALSLIFLKFTKYSGDFTPFDYLLAALFLRSLLLSSTRFAMLLHNTIDGSYDIAYLISANISEQKGAGYHKAEICCMAIAQNTIHCAVFYFLHLWNRLILHLKTNQSDSANLMAYQL